MSDQGKAIGELYGPAMEITDQAEADRYFERLVARHLELQPADTRETAERVQRLNLAYFAGYYDHATRLRVERLFRCTHPLFGPAADGEPDSNEVFVIGRQLGPRLGGKSLDGSP